MVEKPKTQEELTVEFLANLQKLDRDHQIKMKKIDKQRKYMNVFLIAIVLFIILSPFVAQLFK